MRPLLTAIVVLATGFAGVACNRSTPSPTPDASVAVVDAGPVEVALEVSAVGTLTDGGTVGLELAQGEPVQVDPLTGLTVQANLPLTNYRVRVFDEADRALVSDDEVVTGGMAPVTYRIQFPEPLRTGHKYELVIDAQTGVGLMDSGGRSHPDVRLGFQISGEKEKPPAPKKRRR